MAKWTFEPGHTAAEFCVRHMMVTYVRGHFKNVHGTLDFDPAQPEASSVEVVLDATTLWTGDPARDAHLRSSDFLDVAKHSRITFRSHGVELIGEHEYQVIGDLTFGIWGSGKHPGGRMASIKVPRRAPDLWRQWRSIGMLSA